MEKGGQLRVVMSEFVMFIPFALRTWIKDGTGFRHVNLHLL